MTKKFKEFILRKILKPEDYIVGYDGLTGDEIRINVPDVLQKGDSGASAEIQFSANSENWHFPAMENDKYVRFRVGLGEWSVTRFVGLDGVNGTPGIIAYYSADAQSWHATPEIGDQYIQFKLTDNTYTSPIKAFGVDGISPTIEIGEVTTAEAGTPASVTNSGTPQAVVLDFVIPKEESENTTNTTSGLPPNGNPLDFLIIDKQGEPKWLKGFLHINPNAVGLVNINSYAKKIFIDNNSIGDDFNLIVINFNMLLNNNIFADLQEMTIMISNMNIEEGIIVRLNIPNNVEISDNNVTGIADNNVLMIEGGKTKSISLQPIFNNEFNVYKIKATILN